MLRRKLAFFVAPIFASVFFTLALYAVPVDQVMVFFGAGGDLFKRKLLPAIAKIQNGEQLPEKFALVGVSLEKWSSRQFRSEMRRRLAEFAPNLTKQQVNMLLERTFYVSGNFQDPATFKKLKLRLKTIDTNLGTKGNYSFYLAVPPVVFGDVVDGLADSELLKRAVVDGHRRLVVEKPFGENLETAKELNKNVQSRLAEQQVYRIDHYLGKQAVQSLLKLREKGWAFDPIFTSSYIDRIEVNGMESLGIEGRGDYFERSGILRDMVQGHLLEVLAVAAMHKPTESGGEGTRDAKVAFLQSLPEMSPGSVAVNVLAGQYGAGRIGDRIVPNYNRELGVDPNSTTETYVGIRTRSNLPHLSNVPIYLRSAKAMPEKKTEISIVFKNLGPAAASLSLPSDRPAVLRISIDPSPKVVVKIDGYERVLFSSDTNVDPYANLLSDIMEGNRSHFVRADEIEASWRFVDAIRRGWKINRMRPRTYIAGTDGPKGQSVVLSEEFGSDRAVVNDSVCQALAAQQ